MKPLLIALFLLFPALAYGGPTCNASAVIVQGIAGIGTMGCRSSRKSSMRISHWKKLDF